MEAFKQFKISYTKKMFSGPIIFSFFSLNCSFCLHETSDICPLVLKICMQSFPDIYVAVQYVARVLHFSASSFHFVLFHSGSDMEAKAFTLIKERLPLVEQQPASTDEQ